MRWIEHRRHSHRDPGSVHLSERGVALARRIGPGLGPFRSVVTSPAPRASETATSLGFPPDRVEPRLALMGDEVDDELGPIVTWADYSKAVRRSEVVRTFAQETAGVLQEIVRALPDGSRALVVSHGGIVELSAVAALPSHPWRSAGPPSSYLEGVRMSYGASGWRSVDVLRVPPGKPR